MFAKGILKKAKKQWGKAEKKAQKENNKNPNICLQHYANGFKLFLSYEKRKNDPMAYDEALIVNRQAVAITNKKIEDYIAAVSTFEKEYKTIYNQTKNIFEAIDLCFYCCSVLLDFDFVEKDEIDIVSKETLAKLIEAAEKQSQWFLNLGEWKNGYDLYDLIFKKLGDDENIKNKYISTKAKCAYELGKEHYKKGLHYFAAKFFTIAFVLNYPCEKEFLDSMQFLFLSFIDHCRFKAQFSTSNKEKTHQSYELGLIYSDFLFFQKHLKIKSPAGLDEQFKEIEEKMSSYNLDEKMINQKKIAVAFKKHMMFRPLIEIYSVAMFALNIDMEKPLLTAQVLEYIENNIKFFVKNNKNQYERYLIAKKFVLDTFGFKYHPLDFVEVIKMNQNNMTPKQ